MIKVFLCEDEYAIRARIKKSINWEQYGFALVGEAGDGETALPMIRETKPDILLTDIRMPFMDGLTLAKQVKQELPEIKIIVLSGYDDFNYAKQAISIGVEEYLLKPVTSDTLIVELTKVADVINRSQKLNRDTDQELFISNMLDASRKLAEQFFSAKEQAQKEPEKKPEDELDIRKVDVHSISQERVQEFLNGGNAAETETFVRSYFESMGEGMLESVMLRQYVLVKAMFITAAFLEKFGLEKEKTTDVLGELSNPAAFADSVDHAREYMVRLLALAVEQRGLLADRGHAELIEEAKRYIRENYRNEDMSLQTVAAHVNVSSNHFSAIFKKETGETFIDYLTSVRIEKAKELLCCTSMKTSDVGFEVGYRDPHYFSSIFKKTVGRPPKEYRRSAHEDDR